MCSPCYALLPSSAIKELPMVDNLRLTLHEEWPDGGSLSVEINSKASVQNLISSYCAKRGIGYNSKLIILDAKRNALPQYNTLQSLGISNGQTLYVGFKKKKGIMDKKWIFGLSVITISIFVLATIIMSAIYATSGGVVPFDFGIVMDGGSSKTNVVLYKWAGDKHKGTGCVRQDAAFEKKGGMANAKNVSYVLPSLNNATSKITSSLADTPVYFASTAGMRLLNISNPQKTKEVLNSVSQMLNGTGLAVKAVEIITGKDEGLYAWITSNFLKETLETEQKLNPWEPTTVGALDMGGASAQISFAINPADNDSEVEKTTLYGQTHNVFSSSYLCFGRDEAENRHRALLVKDPSKITNIDDPCSPKDFDYIVKGERLFTSVCTESENFKAWVTADPSLKEKNVTFVGTGNYEGCKTAMTELLDPKKCEDQKFTRCFRSINKPLQQQKFLAFATYYYTTFALKLTKSTLVEYINGTQSYCHLTKDDADVKKPFGATYCFNACYMYEVLINGFGFNNETWENIEFLSKVDGKDLGWPLGYMIRATNIIPAKNPSPKFTTVGVFTVCILIFLAVVITAAAFLAYNLQKERSSNISGYP